MEAKFIGCLSYIQQVKLVNKKLEYLHVVFIDKHNKLQKLKKIKKFAYYSRRHSKAKKSNSIGVISRPRWSHILNVPGPENAFYLGGSFYHSLAQLYGYYVYWRQLAENIPNLAYYPQLVISNWGFLSQVREGVKKNPLNLWSIS